MFAYLSKKLEMPQGANVKCVVWSSSSNFLACGCENGMLKVLKIESASNTDENGGGAMSKGILAAPSNIAMNQTLEGHSTSIQVIAWNNVHQKLTTSDAKGLIIVWMTYKNMWYEEMVNNRNRSTVKGLAWSSDGNKICIVYEDGAVIVGSADGNRLWGKDIKGAMLTGVTWSQDVKTLLFPMDTGDIHIYDSNGTFVSKMELEKWPKFPNPEDPNPIVTVRCRPTDSSSSKGDSETPSLAVIWRASRMSLLRNNTDDNPIVVDTMLTATCGDWSPNGLYIAVGGTPTAKDVDFDQVNIFSAVGKFLQYVRCPGSPVASVSWDYLSLRLAIGAGAHVYFANLRPLYKFAFFGSQVFAYVFTRSDGSNHIAFWDTKKLTTQEMPGKVIEVKGDEDHFGVLTVSPNGVYTVAVLNAVGAPVDSLTVVSMEPFTICITDSVLICLATNAVLLWKYQSATSQSRIIREYGSKRKEKMFHIDDISKISVHESSLENGDLSKEFSHKDYSNKPTSDPIVCADAKSSLLVIGRESGKIQMYSLPHGALVTIMEAAADMNIRAQRLFLNMDASQMAILDMGGCLSICSLNTPSIRSSNIKRYDRKDIWNLIWASDNASMFCIVEKTRMYVMKDGEAEEPIITSGYLAYFKGLEVTLILMDEIMQDPENPQKEHVIKIETRALRDTRSLIENETSLANVSRYVEENSHPSLWRLLAQAALDKLDLNVAETSFVRCRDYDGVQFAKRIGTIPNELIRKAEVCSFFEDFENAEKLYLQADRRDLAAEMWKLLGEWKKVETVSQTLLRQRASDKGNREMNAAMGNRFLEEQEWSKALKHFEKADDTAKMVECYLMMGDYQSLDNLIATLPEKSELLPRIAMAFEAVGLTAEAVKAYLACGMAEKAVETAVVLSQWSLAMELAQRHTVQSVGTVLLKYTGHLLQNGEIMRAVELLRKSDKPFAAGKLLAMLALNELRDKEQPNFLMVKKIFVMSAMMFTYKTKKFFRNEPKEKSDRGSSSLKREMPKELESMVDPTDISFENHIPEEFRPTSEEYGWMRETPWRGAKAAHFVLLTQKLIYSNQYGNAVKAALHLRMYNDIIGEERVNTLLALAAANCKLYGVCSRAFINLELIDEDYGEIASEIFGDHAPKDLNIQKVPCSMCSTPVVDWSSSCLSCETKFSQSIVTGRPLIQKEKLWTCSTCNEMADCNEMNKILNCPLCHSQKIS